MTHPDPEINGRQQHFLDTCAPKDRRFHEITFMIGNATFRYHQEASQFVQDESIWLEWIEGLQEPLASNIKAQGFKATRGDLSFTRYVNEKNNLGLQEYLTKNIDPKVMEEFNEFLKP